MHTSTKHSTTLSSERARRPTAVNSGTCYSPKAPSGHWVSFHWVISISSLHRQHCTSPPIMYFCRAHTILSTVRLGVDGYQVPWLQIVQKGVPTTYNVGLDFDKLPASINSTTSAAASHTASVTSSLRSTSSAAASPLPTTVSILLANARNWSIELALCRPPLTRRRRRRLVRRFVGDKFSFCAFDAVSCSLVMDCTLSAPQPCILNYSSINQTTRTRRKLFTYNLAKPIMKCYAMYDSTAFPTEGVARPRVYEPPLDPSYLR